MCVLHRAHYKIRVNIFLSLLLVLSSKVFSSYVRVQMFFTLETEFANEALRNFLKLAPAAASRRILLCQLEETKAAEFVR